MKIQKIKINNFYAFAVTLPDLEKQTETIKAFFVEKTDAEEYQKRYLEEVGVCQNCGIVFEKKRKDQKACSKKCGLTFRVRKFRENANKL